MSVRSLPQGTVESIALKEPRERTKMFECISQSSELAAEYSRKKEALQEAKEDTQFHFNRKKSASVERKQISNDRAEVTEAAASLAPHAFLVLRRVFAPRRRSDIRRCWTSCRTGGFR